jgi:uncharacterized protein YdhG (YjbR/CyaY superfamily)
MTAKNVDEYLEKLPDGQRAVLEDLRQTIKAISPEITELISYDIPSFKYKDRQFVAFAAHPGHCNFFIMSYPIMDAYESDLKRFETDKATIRFIVDNPLPTALLRKLLKARIAEIEAVLTRKEQSKAGKWI